MSDAPSPAPTIAAPILRRADANGIATLTLDDPSSRNALSERILASLSGTLAAIAADRSVRAVVLTAVGPCFSSGHHLKEMSARRADPDRGRAYFADILGRCSAMMQQIVALPQPVIAAVQGLATAAGCQLVATCDLAVASSEARFCTPGVHIGLFCSTPMVALSRNIGRKKTFELLTTGDFLLADQALEMGLVNRVAPEDGLAAETRELAEKVAAKLGSAVRVGKRTFYEQLEMTLDVAYAHTGRVIAENMLHRDTAEGVQAFLEKREPDWPK